MAAQRKLTGALKSPSFIYGLGCGVCVYAIVGLWAALAGPEHLVRIQDHLASQIVPIERPKTESAHAAPSSPAADITLPDPIQTGDSAGHDPNMHQSHEPDASTDNAEKSMRAAPYTGLYEVAADGSLLPVIRTADGLTAFQTYRKPFTMDKEKKLISIVIDDYGLSRGISDSMAEKLDDHVTFLLSPYSRDVEELAGKARGAGHEIWLKLPIENQNFPYDDPGSKAILSRSQTPVNMDNLKWALGRANGYAGVAMFHDMAFSNARPAMAAIIKETIDRGLGLFDINMSAPSQMGDMAGRYQAPYVKNEIIFHDPKWNGDMQEAAKLLETIAQTRGRAVAVFKTYPESLEFLESWIPQLQEKGYLIAPLSAIYLLQNPDADKPMPPIESASEPATSPPATPAPHPSQIPAQHDGHH